MNANNDQNIEEQYEVGVDGKYAPYDFWLSLNGLYELYAYAVKLFGEINGKSVLDCGCGRGHTTVMLAKQGAILTAFDLSDEDIATARILTEKNAVDVKLSSQRIEEMSYPDENFDFAFGSCILHHVDLPVACKEINRVLKPGGKAVFVENSARNIFLMIARKWVVGSFGVPKYGDDEEEHPLTKKDLQTLKNSFPGEVTVHHPDFAFFRMLDFYIFEKRSSFMTRMLAMMDAICGKIPIIKQYGYFQIIEFNKAVN